MSDKIEDVEKLYNKNVHPGYASRPRKFGLFVIPEYPEHEKASKGMWSAAFDAIFTALRYLAPATLLTLFWGQQSFFFRILKQIDLSLRTIVFSSNEQKVSALEWLSEAGPVKVEQLDTVWRHGWILCSVLDAALPGACAGHPPTRLSLKHAQTIADHYLGVDPVFSRQELESCESLSRHQEWKLAQYIDRVRQAITKIPPPVSKPPSQRTSPEMVQFTFDYVARGCGLKAAQVNCKAYFKIYPTAQQTMDPGDITILIRGPGDTYGLKVIPPILGKAQEIRQKLLNLQPKKCYTENVLPITQGANYFRTYGRNDMAKTYHIPKVSYEIEIEAEDLTDCARIGYKVAFEGKHEISIISRGQSIVGSPFTVIVSKDIISTIEKESFCLEDGEEIDIIDVKNDRKAVLRIVDFMTEKMLLREDGTLEKITEEEANLLIPKTNKRKNCKSDLGYLMDIDAHNHKHDKFKVTARNVTLMQRSCDAFLEAKSYNIPKETEGTKKNRTRIPDIVNSTINNGFTKSMNEKYIDNSNICTSTLLEKSTASMAEKGTFADVPRCKNVVSKIVNDLEAKTKNPFKKEYENNEDCNGSQTVNDSNILINPITIIIDENTSPNASPNTNPFITPDGEFIIDRPKTPVLKILTGEIENREDSVYVDPNIEKLTEELLQNNEFINPFFMHQFGKVSDTFHTKPVTNFIIGAPVSIPPCMRTSTPEPNMDSLMMTCNDHTSLSLTDEKKLSILDTKNNTDSYTSNFLSKINGNNIDKPVSSLTFYSLESTETIPNYVPTDIKPVRKDTWDSAYVSIDENNTSSPDSSNHDKSSPNNDRLSIEDLSNVGPAEKELWQTCEALNNNIIKLNDEDKSPKWEFRRPTFTPIIEESDRSMSACTKEPETNSAHVNPDLVTVAFADLNNEFNEYASTSEQSSISPLFDDKLSNQDYLQTATQEYDMKVKSASGKKTDMTRLANTGEGVISEIQTNATESQSVSRNLHHNNEIIQSINETEYSNIVLVKKKYWDEKIRLIEEQFQEPQRGKSPTDVKKPMNKSVQENYKSEEKQSKSIDTKSISQTSFSEKEIDDTDNHMTQDVNLVKKWKSYWDEKLEAEIIDTQRVRTPSPSPLKHQLDKDKEQKEISSLHRDKPELPEEELFKAFETSPKRFFGTSRKNILHRIDSFMGKPIDSKSEDDSNNNGTGLVSRRVSLFHEITHVEELPFKKNKSKSLHNIHSHINNSEIQTLNGVEKNKVSTHSNRIKENSSPQYLGRNKNNYLNNSCEKLNCSSATLKKQNLIKGFEVKSETVERTNKQTITQNEKQASYAKNPNKVIKNKVTTLIQHHETEKYVSNIYKGQLSDYKNSEATSNTKRLPPVKDDKIKRETFRNLNKSITEPITYIGSNLKKNSVSRSEMDIFSKTLNVLPLQNDFDRYKSCEELPKTNVKNFISLYETVTKTAKTESQVRIRKYSSRTSSMGSDKGLHCSNKLSGLTSNQGSSTEKSLSPINSNIVINTPKTSLRLKKTSESFESIDQRHISTDNLNSRCESSDDYISLSDIEVEIVNRSPSTSPKSTPEREINTDPTGYTTRFRMAKQYFVSLEELREDTKKTRKINECEKMLYKLEENTEKQPQKKFKKTMKSHSLPSSELSKVWVQMKDNIEDSKSKFVKISDKFNVKDLFSDVVEGKLSRQGSLRGIPHKKAVLEAFKSMENVTNKNSYQISASQRINYWNEKKALNSQTHLTEYPYLPTTNPSKFYSRYDPNASGLITMKELLNRKRRNSFPELKLNPKLQEKI